MIERKHSCPPTFPAEFYPVFSFTVLDSCLFFRLFRVGRSTFHCLGLADLLFIRILASLLFIRTLALYSVLNFSLLMFFFLLYIMTHADDNILHIGIKILSSKFCPLQNADNHNFNKHLESDVWCRGLSHCSGCLHPMLELLV